MNAYLKIDQTLPAGLDYLNINDFSMPETITSVGDIVSAFNLKNANTIDLVNETSEAKGIITKSEIGSLVGGENFIETHINEQNEFTAVVVFKPIKALSATNLLVSTFTNQLLSTTGKARGFSLSQTASLYPLESDSSMRVANFATAPKLNEWAIVAFSRKNGEYTHASRVAGVSSSVSVSTATLSTQENGTWGLGSTSRIGNTANAENHSIVSHMAIHNKYLTSTELKSYIDALAVELNTIGSDFKL